MDFGTFFVNEVILHRIPKVARAQKATSEPELSQAPSPLDDRRKNFFRERIIESLKTRSLPVVYDNEGTSPVPQLIVDFFKTNGANFIDASREMARHLYALQGGNSPEGALAFVDASIGTSKNPGRCVTVLKLEMDAALLLQPMTTADGRATYDVNIEQVTLNENAKVFKASLFPRAATLAKLAGSASDIQSDDSLFGADVADFFLKFLGCKRRDAADQATLDFKDRTEEFINKFVSDDALKWQIERAMLTELASNQTEIDPKEFVEKYVPSEDLQDVYLAPFRAEDGSVPVIPKETTLVAQALRRRVILYENGLRLEGPADALDAAVDVRNGETTITAGVKEVKARR